MMKQQEVFNKIGGIIKELNEQYEYLETAAVPLNDLELELFVANTHFLADHAEVLRKINKQNLTAAPKPVAEEKSIEEKPASHEERHFEPVIRPADPVETTAPDIDLTTDVPADDYSYIRQEEPETIRHELVVDDTWGDDDEEEYQELAGIEEKVEVPEITDTQPEVMPEAESPTPAKPVKAQDDEVLTINQKISAQMASRTEAALLPITDLKQAITLNDKLLYVKDLFNGYSLAYSEAIEILNRFKTFDEADTFLKKNYVTKNNWDSKPDTSARFYELLKRRYV